MNCPRCHSSSTTEQEGRTVQGFRRFTASRLGDSPRPCCIEAFGCGTRGIGIEKVNSSPLHRPVHAGNVSSATAYAYGTPSLDDRRNTEIAIAVRILNDMLDLGRPDFCPRRVIIETPGKGLPRPKSPRCNKVAIWSWRTARRAACAPWSPFRSYRRLEASGLSGSCR